MNDNYNNAVHTHKDVNPVSGLRIIENVYINQNFD